MTFALWLAFVRLIDSTVAHTYSIEDGPRAVLCSYERTQNNGWLLKLILAHLAGELKRWPHSGTSFLKLPVLTPRGGPFE